MRLELSGTLVRPDPLILKFTANQNLDRDYYVDLGYTHFDVICIGGGGGRGGGIDTNNTGTLIRSYGGAGGGGGFHRVQGLLSALPLTTPIVVGAGGAAGANHVSDPAQTTNGGDGGASTFNNNTCRASGGKGGGRVQSNSATVSTDADGGDGGAGNRTVVGGGALGGTAGTPSATGPGVAGTPGADGTFFGNIGKGGGGGAGGVGKYGGLTLNPATSGGRGSYNPGDTSVYGVGNPPSNDPVTGSVNVIPGGASGAKAAPLNGLPTIYGKSSGDGVGAAGIVIVRLISNVIIKPAAPIPASTLFGQVSRPITFGKSVSGQSGSPVPPNTYGAGEYGAGLYLGDLANFTSVAEISLASHAGPPTQTQHSIKIRARTTTGSTGKIRAALYEGTTNISGDLESDVLTNALADYTLDISDAAAALITSYSNLSIKIWGIDPTGIGLTFEVAEIRLQIPAA